MARSDSHNDKSVSDNPLPEDDLSNCTSARTRPLSFHDIILRRKITGDTAKHHFGALGVPNIESAQDNTVREFDFPECHHKKSYAAEALDEKSNSKYSQKVRSERKGDTNSSGKDENSVQVNDEGSLDPDAKSKSKGVRTASSSRVIEGKNVREDRRNRKKDGLLSTVSVSRPAKRNDRDSYKKDTVSERSRVKSEIVKSQHRNDEREVNRKRKIDGGITSDSDNEFKKRNAKDVRQTDKLTGRGREKPEKENRPKRHHEEDKTRGRINVKKNDSEKKGPKPARTYVEESRPKRRRSHSREREKDRGRRSLSRSPKAYKQATKDRREPGEPSSHPTKDRSGREHSDVDKKRISSNGSSSHQRRNTNSSSGLGGYSPRKRKTDAAAKTPSPTNRSPERRSAGWDLQPVERESIMVGSTVSSLNTTGQILSLNVKEFPSVTPVTTTALKPLGVSLQTLTSQMHAVESIQLTQATRPMRRLYVENLPASASEEDLKESINKLLMSSGVNYIQGTQPCISCIIHKEKIQALLEFLTPEDASTALSLDGMSFSGSNLKLRRPKDYANVTTGLPNKSVGAVDSTSDVVEESPNKIFIGGISKLYCSRMLLEIARAFGQVKAFHFEFIADINEPCAFLEYGDNSVTSKACAGLNGMRLGGQVLTAVLASQEPLSDDVGKKLIYGIPEHAKPLLEKPTTVLKLKNVLGPDCLDSLSESELEEILEDIKLECSRFGTVNSVNVAKPTKTFTTKEAYQVKNSSASADLEYANRSHTVEQLGETTCGAGELEKSEPREAPNEVENSVQNFDCKNGFDNSTDISELSSVSIEPTDTNASVLVGGGLAHEQPPTTDEDVSVKVALSQENPVGFTGESTNQENASDIELENTFDKGQDKPSTEKEWKLEENDNNAKIVSCVELESDKRKDVLVDVGGMFEVGSVFVEYRREEAACMAAHCLHGRTFDGRVVTVEYVGHDLYQMRFRG